MPAKNAKLSASQEDYLEAVLHLVRRSRVARVRDLAERLGVAKSSVTAALKSLSRRGLINYDPYQVITLTDKGREAAEAVSRRHHLLRRFCAEVLGLDADASESNACRMEHAMDADALRRIERLVDFVDGARQRGDDWLAELRKACPPSGADRIPGT